MGSFIVKRLFLAVITIVGVSIIVFVCARLSGDVTFLLLPTDATEQDIRNIRQSLGLDQPLWVQFMRFVAAVFHGDFGESIKYQVPAMDLVVARIPATVQLTLSAFLISIVVGIPLGVLAALRRNSVSDWTIRSVAVLGQSMPNFWIGLMLILLFAVKLQWLPSSGRGGFSHLILPAFTLALFGIAAIMRVTRSSLLEQLDMDYVRFLSSKGLSARLILWKHMLRNAIIPVLALCGVLLANLIGGAVIIEAVFNWPGLGSLVVESVVGRDYPVIQAAVILTSVFLILLNLSIDVAFGVVDPRIRYQ